jgi:hypothetical protein
MASCSPLSAREPLLTRISPRSDRLFRVARLFGQLRPAGSCHRTQRGGEHIGEVAAQAFKVVEEEQMN